MKKLNLHKLSLSIALVGAVAFGSSAWACEKPQVSGYDNVDCLKAGLARVEQNGKWGLIDRTGKAVAPVQYDYVDSFEENLARVEQNGKWGFIDTTGKVVIPVQYDYASIFSFRTSLAEVEQDGETFHIDKTGKRVD